MLKSWRLSNFKAVGSELELDLKSLTLVAGANSSGKSTLLQSILLFAQTLRSRAGGHPIVLNGDFVKLGDFSDIKSIHTKEQSVRVGFELAPSGHRSRRRLLRSRARLRSSGSGDLPSSAPGGVALEIVFDDKPYFPTSEDAHLYPLLKTVEIRVQDAEDNLFPNEAATVLKATTPIEGIDPQLYEDSMGVTPLVPQHSSANAEPQGANAQWADESTLRGDMVGTKMFHFLPDRFLVLYRVSDYLAAATRSAALTGKSTGWPGRTLADDDALIKRPLSAEVVNILCRYLAPEDPLKGLLGSSDEVTVRNLIEMRRRVSPLSTRRALASAVDEDALAKDLAEVLGRQYGKETIVLHRPVPDDLLDACREVYNFFVNFVRYVGPLRDDPKAIYPLSSSADTREVGAKGEATAAVFNRFRKEKIDFVPPEAFGEAKDGLSTKTMTLEEGVLSWLRYLGVARGVNVKDRSKFGHELKIQMGEKEGSFDISHVGVGVSQLLPVVVSCLLAKPGSLLIFEQPELHLHPKVQTLLADFLLAAAASGRQCIVETHSEYLVNRLRLRIAESAESEISDLTEVFFVEQDSKGNAMYRSIDINEYGAVLDWPEGFFDQSQIEAEKIIKEASKKRSRRNQKQK
jgi:predicted ATPase